MATMRDIVWVHVTPVGSTKRFTCNHCLTEPSGNPIHLQAHMPSRCCTASNDIKKVMLHKLEEGRHEHTTLAVMKQPPDKQARPARCCRDVMRMIDTVASAAASKMPLWLGRTVRCGGPAAAVAGRERKTRLHEAATW